MHQTEEKYIQVVRITRRKETTSKPRRRWEYNLKETGLESVDRFLFEESSLLGCGTV
jgi:hypothetical protein